MKKFVILLIFVFMIAFAPMIKGDEIDDIKSQLDNLNRDLTASVNATKPLESELTALQKRLDTIKAQAQYLQTEITRKTLEVKKGEEALDYQKKILDQRVFVYYKNAKKAEISFISLLTAENLSTSLQNFFYQKTLADQDKQTIIKVILYIKNLEDTKKNLESENIRLAALKTDIDENYTFLNGEVSKAKQYQSELSNKIAQLSARQQSLLAQKLAGLNIPQSAYNTQGGCKPDFDTDPGFSNRFAFATFGVPHRVGLNQYGAKGRAEAGQSAEDILKAYYNNIELKKDYDQGINIHVTGTNEYGQTFDDNWNIEEYVKHIYEMPTDWSTEALKAQAIAARSFALALTNNGSDTICPSQSCQVVKKEENSDRWKQAVDDTKGWVMTNGGKPIKAWFSSTHGGYGFTSGDIWGSSTDWTKRYRDSSSDINSFDDLKSKAYDRGSPWFYCDWGNRAEYNKTAWLKSEEVADIVNIILLAKADSSTQNHLSQVDKSNPDGTDTWNADKVKQELKNRSISPYNSVSSVSVNVDFGAGKTNSVSVSGDAGQTSVSATEFKDYFNLRSPANIQIVGPLFNVEHR